MFNSRVNLKLLKVNLGKHLQILYANFHLLSNRELSKIFTKVRLKFF